MWKKSSSELVDLFIKTMDAFSGVERKKMFGYPCCFISGNMFTGLHQENWVVRLSEADRDEAKKTFDATPFEPMAGRVMREYIVLPKQIVEKEASLDYWVQKSFAFAASLPPKS